MLASMPERVFERWVRYYDVEPWDLPREYWPDVSKQRKSPNVRTERKQTSREQLSFFESLIASGKVIDLRGKRTPRA